MSDKLIYVVRSYYPQLATHEIHLYPFIEELAKQVDIFVIVERGAWPNATHVKVVRNLNLDAAPNVLVRVWRVICAYREALNQGYRRLYINYSRYGAFIGALIMKLGRGTSYYWHCFGDQHYFGTERSKRTRRILELISHFVDFFVSGTPHTAEVYSNALQLPRHRFKVVPNCVDLSRYNGTLFQSGNSRARLALPSDRPIILFVHTLSPDRGTRLLVPMVQEIVRAISDVLLVIVGDGPDRSYLEQLITSTNLARSIWLVGRVANITLPDYYVASDIFIMPSLTECFPRVILEAMAVGRPIVASNVGGVPEILPPAAHTFLVRPGDAVGLANAVIELLQNVSLCMQLSAAELEGVAQYSVQAVAQNFIAQIVRS